MDVTLASAPEPLAQLRRAGGNALRVLADLLAEPASNARLLPPADVDVALVFADIAGYSDFVRREGDDAAMEVLALLEAHVVAALDANPGLELVKRLGDGVMLATARSDEAIAAAVSLVGGFCAQARERGWPVALRAGAHRGTCRHQDGDYVGYHVNLAARVADSAKAEVTLATPNVLAGVDLDTLGLRGRPAGRLRAKGVEGRVALFRLFPA